MPAFSHTGPALSKYRNALLYKPREVFVWRGHRNLNLCQNIYRIFLKLIINRQCFLPMASWKKSARPAYASQRPPASYIFKKSRRNLWRGLANYRPLCWELSLRWNTSAGPPSEWNPGLAANLPLKLARRRGSDSNDPSVFSLLYPSHPSLINRRR